MRTSSTPLLCRSHSFDPGSSPLMSRTSAIHVRSQSGQTRTIAKARPGTLCGQPRFHGEPASARTRSRLPVLAHTRMREDSRIPSSDPTAPPFSTLARFLSDPSLQHPYSYRRVTQNDAPQPRLDRRQPPGQLNKTVSSNTDSSRRGTSLFLGGPAILSSMSPVPAIRTVR
ncbi:hypothetical protein BC628DRAFT_893285 [Trametes gibbosa]|nr:hypothetical protein BC628DRAFT_893285 [Trametes gibbosa]